MDCQVFIQMHTLQFSRSTRIKHDQQESMLLYLVWSGIFEYLCKRHKYLTWGCGQMSQMNILYITGYYC